jgi:hypothetical protein
MSYVALNGPPPPPPPPLPPIPDSGRRESVYTSSFALPYYSCFQTCADELRRPVSECRVMCSAGSPMPHPPMGDGEGGIGIGFLVIAGVAAWWFWPKKRSNPYPSASWKRHYKKVLRYSKRRFKGAQRAKSYAAAVAWKLER